MTEQPYQTTEPRKLVLPAYPDEQRPVPSVYGPPLPKTGQAGLPGRPAVFTNPFITLKGLWQRDPAYKVLFIAAALVIVSGVVLIALASAAVLQPAGGEQNVVVAPSPPVITPAGTTDLRPTFPTPGGGNGSSTSSQPPAVGTTSPLQGTPDLTPVTQSGTLSVQIVGVPNPVSNFSRVSVEVQTNALFAEVRLQVYYTVPPFVYNSPQRPTDGNGNASIPWRVRVNARGAQVVTATVVAMVTDQNGQVGTSAPVEVQVIVGG